MKKCHALIVTLIGITPLLFAETQAQIEVKLFKNWVIEREHNFGNLAIKNTGAKPFLLAKDAFHFEVGQLAIRPLSRNPEQDATQEKEYQRMVRGDDKLFSLPSGETHVYEGHKIYFDYYPFAEEMRFIVSVYLGKGLWLDSDPLTVRGVVPDSEEDVATITHNTFASQGRDNGYSRKLVSVTYKNERWLYMKSVPNPQLRGSGGAYYPVCPVSLTNKIRVEPHDDALLFKIWDGDKSMIFHMTQNLLMEGPDENNVLGKWTRERKQKAEADNAEVRRKKAEAQ